MGFSDFPVAVADEKAEIYTNEVIVLKFDSHMFSLNIVGNIWDDVSAQLNITHEDFIVFKTF